MDAPELAHLFLDWIFHYHRFPQAIVSDWGLLFISSFFTQLMKICGTKMKPSTVFHPQTDGLNEQTNQTLETYLWTYCSYQQDIWVDYLALMESVFNNTLNLSTQQTPSFANIGFHPEFNITICYVRVRMGPNFRKWVWSEQGLGLSLCAVPPYFCCP